MAGVLVVCGSGDPKGISYSVCDAIDGLLDNMGIPCTVLYPYEMDIGHCTGCEMCEVGDCPFDDDMGVVMDRMSDSDLLILVSPIHFSGPSSIIKTVMDRLQPFWHSKDMAHPGYVAGVLCGGSLEPCFSHTESIIRAMSITVGMEVLGFHHIKDTDHRSIDDCVEGVPDFIGSIIGRTTT